MARHVLFVKNTAIEQPNSVRQSKILKRKLEYKIAVTYEDGKIYQHFGHTSQFKLYDIED